MIQTQQTYPAQQYQAYYPVRTTQTALQPSAVLVSGMFGMVVGGSTVMAMNLHRVQDNRMTMGQAVADSLAKGAGAGVATACAVAVARSIGGSHLLNFAVLLATATGVGYLINYVGKSEIKPSESRQTCETRSSTDTTEIEKKGAK